MATHSKAVLDFSPVGAARDAQTLSRPSLSYWQDAWLRLKANRRALVSLFLVIGLLLFTLVGPWLWRVNPAAQDLDIFSNHSDLFGRVFFRWHDNARENTYQPGDAGGLDLARVNHNDLFVTYVSAVDAGILLV